MGFIKEFLEDFTFIGQGSCIKRFIKWFLLSCIPLQSPPHNRITENNKYLMVLWHLTREDNINNLLDTDNFIKIELVSNNNNKITNK